MKQFGLNVTVPLLPPNQTAAKEDLLADVAARLEGCADCFGVGAGTCRADFNFAGYALAALFVVNAVTSMALDIFDFVLHCKLPLFQICETFHSYII